MRRDAELLATTLVVLAAGLAAFGLANLIKPALAKQEGSLFKGYAEYKIIKDEETGCEYIRGTYGEGGLTPRLDTSGGHICNQKP